MPRLTGWTDIQHRRSDGLHVIGHDVDMAGLRFDIGGGSDSMLIHLTLTRLYTIKDMATTTLR